MPWGRVVEASVCGVPVYYLYPVSGVRLVPQVHVRVTVYLVCPPPLSSSLLCTYLELKPYGYVYRVPDRRSPANEGIPVR